MHVEGFKEDLAWATDKWLWVIGYLKPFIPLRNLKSHFKFITMFYVLLLVLSNIIKNYSNCLDWNRVRLYPFTRNCSSPSSAVPFKVCLCFIL